MRGLMLRWSVHVLRLMLLILADAVMQHMIVVGTRGFLLQWLAFVHALDRGLLIESFDRCLAIGLHILDRLLKRLDDELRHAVLEHIVVGIRDARPLALLIEAEVVVLQAVRVVVVAKKLLLLLLLVVLARF